MRSPGGGNLTGLRLQASSSVGRQPSYRAGMRVESSVLSVSWIPSEAVKGLAKLPFGMGLAHHDAPPPDDVDDLDVLRADDRFRFANQLEAWAEVEDGRITSFGFADTSG